MDKEFCGQHVGSFYLAFGISSVFETSDMMTQEVHQDINIKQRRNEMN